jgi:hypothetical protein
MRCSNFVESGAFPDAVHVQRIMEKAYRSGKEMKIFEV